MGKHSSSGRSRPPKGRSKPQQIRRLEPRTEARETPQAAARRQRQASRMVDPRVRQRKRRRRLTISLGILGLIVAGVAVAAFAFVGNLDQKLRPVDRGSQSELDKILANEADREPGEPFYMLLIGVDTRPGDTKAHSDTLLIAHVDPRAQKIQLISIPRDTRVTIPGRGKDKINAAMFSGGAPLTIKTVKQMTGLPISHYAIVNFDGFKQIVDTLGGVTVYVPVNINDMQAANHVRSAAYIPKGLQTLDGAHALTFVRARKQFPTQDLQRVQNQQTFLKALYKKAMEFSNPFKLPALLNSVADAVETDLSLKDLAGLALDFRGMPEQNVETITMPGEARTIDGLSYVIPDDDEFEKIIERMEQGLPLSGEASATVSAGSTEGEFTAKDITITVRNGAGVSGLAKSAQDRLIAQGFNIVETGNMAQFVYGRTLVVFQDDAANPRAIFVRESLGMGDVVASRGMYSFSTDVLVVVGKDWDPAVAGVPGADARH